MTRLPIGTRVLVVQSDRGHTGMTGTVVRHARGWHYPYEVRLDQSGHTILTNDLGVTPIDTPTE